MQVARARRLARRVCGCAAWHGFPRLVRPLYAYGGFEIIGYKKCIYFTVIIEWGI
jgi:hypothetical protein